MDLLRQYKDKSYISCLLAEQSHNYYVFIKNIINIPLIILNTVMVIINAMITDHELLKVLNIILNSSTGLILSLISNFKIYENIQQFQQLKIKFNKLTHQIDSKITNDMDEISSEFIYNILNEYDSIYESIEFSFPDNIKTKIKNQFKDRKLSLPTSLTIDVVSIKEKACCINPSVV
jgi:hypothetical protein